MTTIVEDLREGKKVITDEVRDGQIRTNACGRVIMAITDVRFPGGSARNKTLTLRALMIKEQTKCNGGKGVPFTTIPREYTREEMAQDFPIVLEGTVSFYSKTQ